MAGRDIMNCIEREGWSVVDEWVRENQPEGLHLEFKLKTTPTRPDVEPDDRALVGKALSGFANVEGGVLVIGIATRNVKGGADKVQGVASITGVTAFAGKLERDIRTLTDPPIAGLIVKPVLKAGAEDTGVVAIYVPESDGGPHRVANGTTDVNDRYFMRTAASTVTMPHSLLADRFGRQAQPKLRLLARLHGGGANIQLLLRLRNEGRGTARRPAVHIIGISNHLGWRSLTSLARGWTILWERGVVVAPEEVIYQSSPSDVIYPNVTVTVANLEAGTNAGQMLGSPLVGRIYAEDMRPVEFAGALALDVDTLLPSIPTEH